VIDTHAHLADDAFADDLDAVHARAVAAGVTGAIVIGTTLATSQRAVELAERYAGWQATVGVHPHECAAYDAAAVAALRRLAAHPKVVAIGETGLDFHYAQQPRAAQERAFAGQVELAAELGLPVVVHSRDSLAAIQPLLHKRLGSGGVMHSFTGAAEEARPFLELGMYVSFSGILTFKNAPQVRTTATAAPVDRILVETDAPYLSPVPLRGHRNEPAHVTYIVATLATCRGIPVSSVIAVTSANAQACFGANRRPC